jgi:catalase
LVRFSNSTGVPNIPDTDDNSKPHGFALRFNLGLKDGKRWHTDVIGHSTPHFPVRTGEEFAEFLKAIGGSGPDVPSPKPVEKFLGTHPAALAFVQAPKPFPKSYATEAYFALSAFQFIAADGSTKWIRYRLVPTLGKEALDDEAVKTKGPDYLQEEIVERVKSGPISFKLIAQIGADGDPTDDITQQWPEDRELVDLGHIELDKKVEDDAEEQRYTIFDPIPRVEGIEPSKDPLLEFRAALYIISGRKRRENKVFGDA